MIYMIQNLNHSDDVFFHLSIGTFRFFSVQSVLQTGHFPLSQVSIGLASLSVFGILSVTMACIVSLHIGSK